MISKMALAALFACPIALASAQTPDKAPLTVCMQQTDPPLSLRAGEKPSGFDLELAHIIAQRLGRDLSVQWFTSRDDPDASVAKDSNALLSDGRCQLVAEFPLTEHTLAPLRAPTTRLPPFAGAKPGDRVRWVKVGELTATRPYRLDGLTVVLSSGNAGRKVTTLRDLDGLRIGVQISSLADAISMRYDDGRFRETVAHVSETPDLFGKLQAGELDAALVDLRAFDAWRLRHGSSGTVATGYLHSIVSNMAYVGLMSNQTLIEQVNAVLADLQAHDAIAPLAASAGLTFIAPRQPDVQPDIRLAALNGD